ncbi:MAG: 4Fe-4S binding protein [bacterium]
MRKKSVKILPCVLCVCLLYFIMPSIARGVRRVSPPEFESGYTFPQTRFPAPRKQWYDYIDCFVLVCALLLAAYYVLKRRSRRGIFILMLFSLVYFGFWKKGCICSIGSIQNIALALFNPSYSLPVTVLLFFILPLLSALFFGRVFCAAVCPIGAVQDCVVFRPVKVPPWAEHSLGMIPAIYLGIAVLYAAMGSHFLICRFDPVVSFFRLSGSFVMLFWSALFLCVSMIIARPYCRFLCPYGILLRWCSRLSKWHMRITPDECIQCRLCEESCPFGAIQKPSEESGGPGREKLRRIVILSIAFPCIIVLGVCIGTITALPLSRLDARVRLAEQIWHEDADDSRAVTLESETFRSTGKSVTDLYQEALRIQKRFQVGGFMLGGFLGVIFGSTLLFLSLGRRGNTYEPDRGLCLSCGRCFAYCPKEHVRIKEMREHNDRPIQNS